MPYRKRWTLISFFLAQSATFHLKEFIKRVHLKIVVHYSTSRIWLLKLNCTAKCAARANTLLGIYAKIHATRCFSFPREDRVTPTVWNIFLLIPLHHDLEHGVVWKQKLRRKPPQFEQLQSNLICLALIYPAPSLSSRKITRQFLPHVICTHLRGIKLPVSQLTIEEQMAEWQRQF